MLWHSAAKTVPGSAVSEFASGINVLHGRLVPSGGSPIRPVCQKSAGAMRRCRAWSQGDRSLRVKRAWIRAAPAASGARRGQVAAFLV